MWSKSSQEYCPDNEAGILVIFEQEIIPDKMANFRGKRESQKVAIKKGICRSGFQIIMTKRPTEMAKNLAQSSTFLVAQPVPCTGIER